MERYLQEISDEELIAEIKRRSLHVKPSEDDIIDEAPPEYMPAPPEYEPMPDPPEYGCENIPVDFILNQTKDIYEELSDNRDSYILSKICEHAYYLADENFMQILTHKVMEVKDGNGRITFGNLGYFDENIRQYMDLDKQGIIDRVREMEPSLFSNITNKHDIHGMIRDEILWFIMQKPPNWPNQKQIPVRFRLEAFGYFVDIFNKLYKEDLLELNTSANISGFAEYCLRNFPRIIKESYYFIGEHVKNSRLAYRQVVREWKGLTKEQRGDFLNIIQKR